ncbi:MAG TPA: HAD family hydrolase [Rugosimonospora sp.]|nr:HAD family hydrolase [Rugosimonospora sp.]
MIRGLPKLIATDLDGTLVGDGFGVSRRNADALRLAARAGIPVILVTGRPIRWLPLVYADLGERYLAVCANGAVVYDPVADLVRDSWPLLPEELARACDRLRAAVPGVVFAAEVDGGRSLRHEPGWPVRYDADNRSFPADLADLVAAPAVKLLARCPGLDADTFSALAAATAGDLVEATHSSYSGVVEMSRRGVTKATGLARIAAELGVAAEDVLAFGDMPNDVSMLTWAGRSVAVANAHALALAAADETTLSNVDDGVAAYLEPLLAA